MDIDLECKRREVEGKRKYGEINPVDDSRCFRKETLNELLDSVNYNLYSYRKGQISFIDWKIIDRKIRLLIDLVGRSCPGVRWKNLSTRRQYK